MAGGFKNPPEGGGGGGGAGGRGCARGVGGGGGGGGDGDGGLALAAAPTEPDAGLEDQPAWMEGLSLSARRLRARFLESWEPLQDAPPFPSEDEHREAVRISELRQQGDQMREPRLPEGVAG